MNVDESRETEEGQVEALRDMRADAALRALAERDAARAELMDVLAENDALRFVLNNMRAGIDALRARLTAMEGRDNSEPLRSV